MRGDRDAETRREGERQDAAESKASSPSHSDNEAMSTGTSVRVPAARSTADAVPSTRPAPTPSRSQTHSSEDDLSDDAYDEDSEEEGEIAGPLTAQPKTISVAQYRAQAKVAPRTLEAKPDYEPQPAPKKPRLQQAPKLAPDDAVSQGESADERHHADSLNEQGVYDFGAAQPLTRTAAIAEARMTPEQFRSWTCFHKNDRRRNDMVGVPCIWTGSVSGPEFVNQFWYWVSQTKRVDIDAMKTLRTRGQVLKYHEMRFRFAHLFVTNRVEEDIAATQGVGAIDPFMLPGDSGELDSTAVSGTTAGGPARTRERDHHSLRASDPPGARYSGSSGSRATSPRVPAYPRASDVGPAPPRGSDAHRDGPEPATGFGGVARSWRAAAQTDALQSRVDAMERQLLQFQQQADGRLHHLEGQADRLKSESMELSSWVHQQYEQLRSYRGEIAAIHDTLSRQCAVTTRLERDVGRLLDFQNSVTSELLTQAGPRFRRSRSRSPGWGENPRRSRSRSRSPDRRQSWDDDMV